MRLPLIWVPFLVLGWIAYFAGRGNAFALPLLLLGTILVAFFTRRDWLRAKAANNVVAAAATYASLTEPDKALVHKQAVEIIRRSGWRGSTEPSFPDDCARYGWYALAMAELNIRPVCMAAWNFIRNPYNAISLDDSNIASSLQLARKSGFDVQISRNSANQRR